MRRQTRSHPSPLSPLPDIEQPPAPHEGLGPLLRYWRRQTLHRFHLSEDKAPDEVIDHTLRQGVQMRGTNLWVLVLAIVMASVGLNVNSTAVIIGAMLISPLMGPLMGLGYGVGINDFQLMRESLKNLGVAVLLALLTSTLYFALTPLSAAQSELLARTTPTIWDVLIALLGGLAGIIGLTRREKSNVIPGVAIATALMPPLCTAGYGLANANATFFFGAFYLFAINSVFIAVAAALVTRAFHVQEKTFVDTRVARRVRSYMMTIVVVTVLPSVFLAYQLVQEEVFKSRAARFVSTEFSFPRTHVTQTQIDPKARAIDVTLVGEHVPAERLASVAERLAAAGLSRARLDVHQADSAKLDVTELKTGLLSDLYTKSQQALEGRDQTIAELRSQLQAHTERQQQLAQLPQELRALLPQVQAVWLAPQALHWQAEPQAASAPAAVPSPSNVLLNLGVNRPISTAERTKIEDWLRQRLPGTQIRLVVEVQSDSVKAK